jgi:hypothetical protein
MAPGCADQLKRNAPAQVGSRQGRWCVVLTTKTAEWPLCNVFGKRRGELRHALGHE